MTKQIKNGNKIHDVHMRMGQETIDKLNEIKHDYGLAWSQAIRWAIHHADFGGNEEYAETGSAEATPATDTHSQEELLVMEAEVKVLNGLKGELHKIGSNLNQVAHSMNTAELEGNLVIHKEDVDSILRLHDDIKAEYDTICPIIEHIKERCSKQ